MGGRPEKRPGRASGGPSDALPPLWFTPAGLRALVRGPVGRKLISLWPWWLFLLVASAPFLLDAIEKLMAGSDARCSGMAPDRPPESFDQQNAGRPCTPVLSCYCNANDACGWHWGCAERN